MRGEAYAIALFLPVLFYANVIQGVLLFQGAAIRGQVFRLHFELHEENAGWLLAAPGMRALVALSNDMRRLTAKNSVGLPFTTYREYVNINTLSWKPYETMERGIIPDDALAISGGLGMYYYLPDLMVIDRYGLADAAVARTPVTHSNLRRFIAHDRSPSPEYLRQRGVNLRIFSPAPTAAEALERADYAVRVGSELWMPFNAVNAQWAAARFADRDLRARQILSTGEPSLNQFHVNGHSYIGEQYLGHFEYDFDGWQLAGEAVSNFNQHANYEGQSFLWGRAGSGFLTTYHPSKGNDATGRARSPKFVATADQCLAFLIAGGDGEKVGLRLLADGEEVAVWRGSSNERFELIVHPLAYVAGKSLQLELFDQLYFGERGHVMLDHVMLVNCSKCQMDEWSILARGLISQPTNTDTVYLVPAFKQQLDFRYLYQGKAPVHIVPIGTPDLALEVETALLGTMDATVVKLIEWNTLNEAIDDDIDSLAFLLIKYGRYLGSEEYDDFLVHSYANISHVRPWTFYDRIEPLLIDYEGGIYLRGFALGQGAEQLSSEQLLNLESERSLWGILQWRIDPDLDVDYAISLRLHDAEGELVYQWDDLLWNPANHTTTSQWSADEPVDTLFQIEFPAVLKSGEYELRQVVYDYESQAPTVQQDVWQPEITLARLRLAAAR